MTQEFDPHADFVAEELNRRAVPFTRLHTSDFPQQMTLVARCGERWSSSLRFHGRTLDLDQVTSVWYRRPTRFRQPPDLTDPEKRFAHIEATMALGGLFETMDCLWVNHPARTVTAGYKPLQLGVAARCGFRIPHSLLTNDPAEFTAFCREFPDNVVYKVLGWAAIGDTDESELVFTSLIDGERVDELAPRVRLTANLFQEYVPKQLELRVTVVGDDVHAVALHSQATLDGRVDWRLAINETMRYENFTLPPAEARRCVEVVRALGIEFGAIDLILTPEDELVFLEVNPGGQWAWLQEETGVPIRESLIALLQRGKAAARVPVRA